MTATDDILHGLNKAQREAVTSDASVLQVLAPPGSGKTKTLTTRVAHLIRTGLQPWNIITCTFTKKAANEMKERLRSFIGDELAKKIRLGTFHAISAQYLRQYGQHIGLPKDFGIADTSDSKAIIKRIIKKHDLTSDVSKAMGRISSNKCKGVGSDHFARTQTVKNVDQQEFALIFAEYEAELNASNLLDYDDLLLRCCFLLRTHPQVVSNVEAVLIDEFQDTNTIQYDLMGLFAQKRNHITIVGDPDQSIYGFRHAEIKNLNLMRQQWPDTLTINLEENYRSSGAILNAAQNIIEQDESRPSKALQATHSHGQRPVLRKLPSAAAEAAWLVAETKRMHTLCALEHSDFAVLLRSAALSRVIEAALGKAGIPYRMVGGMKFFDRAEVKLIVDYLRVINQPSHSEAVERIINVPPRRIGDATVKSLREEASSKNVSFWDLICDVAQGRRRCSAKLNAPAEKGLASFVNVILSGRRRLSSTEGTQSSLVDLINLVAKKIDLQAFLKSKYENEFDARWSNVEELMAQAEDVSDPAKLKAMMEENVLPDIDGMEQRATTNEDILSIFLANIALTSSAEEKTGGEPVSQLTISTIHSAKGLEWPVVFIPGCFEGSIPHSRSEDTDEERRLLYVGMTRAQGMLYLSCPIKDTQKQETTLSSFLAKPGVSTYFEEHGPSISLASAQALATTLRREPPTALAWNEAKQNLERDEDNYWPLNGEEAPEERAKWDYGNADNPLPGFATARSAPWTAPGSATMHQQDTFCTASATMGQGFVSVKAKYEELLEENRLKAIDKRADEKAKKQDTTAPRGRKRQLEGQSTLAGFFAKRSQPVAKTTDEAEFDSRVDYGRHTSPLREVTNINRSSPPRRPMSSAAHKPRTAPLRSAQPSQLPATAERGYVFLSSSPRKAEDEENVVTTEDVDGTGVERHQPQFQAASTFHTTSLQALQQQQSVHRGRRYGVRPSFNGWANRMNR